MISTKLTKLFNIDMPIIMAPMFLVSDTNMVKAAILNRIIGTFPTLNYRESEKLETALTEINTYINNTENPGTYGVNLITQKSNPYYKKHLEICVKNKVPFYITSLGNPNEVIEKAHKYGAKVFCDVTNLTHAEKVYNLGADGIIAVGQGAGGHAGPDPLQILIPALKKKFEDFPIIAAGGISTGTGLHSVLVLGADGASIGTKFIASVEAPVSQEYKEAIVNAKSEDIVMTERLSGTPSSIINTPYAKKIGYKQNWFERVLSKNPRTKKYFKMLIQVKGMKKLEKSVKPGNYKNLWIAGKSVEFIDEILPINKIINNFKTELEKSIKNTMF
ncbi:MAG: nitronate monooxygenase [Bacteroidales bacterium]|nr:nitronate monooxygenase [Bacteroidales bacterium]